MKPGWVRLTLPYYASEDEVDFMLRAVELVASIAATRSSATTASAGATAPGATSETRHATCFQIELVPAALTEAAARFTGKQADAPAPSLDFTAARRQYFLEAEQVADELEACAHGLRHTCGDPGIDPLIWFRFVHADGL